MNNQFVMEHKWAWPISKKNISAQSRTLSWKSYKYLVSELRIETKTQQRIHNNPVREVYFLLLEGHRSKNLMLMIL
jgi:hypothetical protein